MNWIKKAAAHIYVFFIFPMICVVGLFGTLVLCEMLFQKYFY